MSKNNIDNIKDIIEHQINSLFDDLSNDTSSISTLSINSNLPGWEWESDINGNYTSCGNSIEMYLGVNPEEPINKKISTYSVAANSILPIENAFISTQFPADVFAHFLTSSSETITVHIKIYQKFDEVGEIIGFQGFSQIINLSDTRAIAKDNKITPSTFEEPHLGINNPSMQHLYTHDENINNSAYIQKPSLDSASFDQLISNIFDDSEDIDIQNLINQLKNNNGTQVLLELIDNDPNRVWSDEEIFVVEQVADQLLLAINNAELFQQTQSALATSDEQSRRLSLLNELNNQITENKSPDEVNQIAAEICKQVFQADHVSVLVPTDNAAIYRMTLSIGEEAISREGGLITQNGFANSACLQSENNISVLKQSSNLGQNIQSLMSGHIHLYSETYCIINIGKKNKASFIKDDETFFQQILNILISYYQNKNLITEIGYALNSAEEQSRRLRVLNSLADLLNQSTDIEIIISSLSEKIAEALKPTQVKISLMNQDDNLIVYSNLGEIPNPVKGEIQSKQLGIQQCLINGEMNQTLSREFDNEPFYSCINAPLFSGDQIIGVITINDFEVDKFNQADINILNQMISLTSNTIENINLFNQIQKRSSQLQTTAEVSQRASRTLNIEELIKETLELIQNGFDFIHSSIYLLNSTDNNVIQLHTQVNNIDHDFSIPKSIDIQSDSYLTNVKDSIQSISFTCDREHPLPYQHPESLAILILPLISREFFTGCLIVQSNKFKKWANEDISTLITMSDQLSSSIDNARLYSIAQQKAEQERIVREVSETLSRTSGYDGVMQTTLEEINKLIDSKRITIHIGTKEQLLRYKKIESTLPSIHRKNN